MPWGQVLQYGMGMLYISAVIIFISLRLYYTPVAADGVIDIECDVCVVSTQCWCDCNLLVWHEIQGLYICCALHKFLGCMKQSKFKAKLCAFSLTYTVYYIILCVIIKHCSIFSVWSTLVPNSGAIINSLNILLYMPTINNVAIAIIVWINLR